jgi:hypothetical protein
MPSFRWMSYMRNAAILSAAVAFAVGFASAESAPSLNPSSAPTLSANESSSTESSSAALQLVAGNDAGAEMALPSAPSAAASGAGQQQSGGYQSNSIFSHLTFAIGGGFNGPLSESSPYITWGGNFNLDGGYRFNPYLSMMIEYQFISDKLPGALIAETGAEGGHAHIWSFTMAPIVDLMPNSTNSVYVTGGGGFYRKVTSFTNPQLTYWCDYFYCYPGYTDQVVGHFSSNQGGWNVGGGFTHRFGGSYNPSRMKFFAEVRYLDVLTPAVTTEPNGLGTTSVGANTKLIPVTLGLRW